MLRVTIHDSAVEVRFQLEGRLAGAWVQEAALCWETAQSKIAGRPVVVDLEDVEFVDAEGEQLLAAMHRDGAKLRAACPLMAHLIVEIATAEQQDVSHEKEGCQWPAMLP
jgi:anti-anti-sigma regulatory factor